MQTNYITVPQQPSPCSGLSLLISPAGSAGFPWSPWCGLLHRVLVPQGTLQKFLDDLFKAILSIRDDKPPLAVKYFFDFLEEQAEKRGITDPDTMHIWKTNRFGKGNLFCLFLPCIHPSGAAAAHPRCPGQIVRLLKGEKSLGNRRGGREAVQVEAKGRLGEL